MKAGDLIPKVAKKGRAQDAKDCNQSNSGLLEKLGNAFQQP
jgi:hypothetical protein